MSRRDAEAGLIDEFDEALSVYQTLKPAPESAPRWDLTEDAFARWWGCLVADDRNEFMYFYGGDIVLARFVAAYDYLVSRELMPSNGAPIVLGYAIAAGLNPNENACKVRAAKAWKHPAVQGLLGRIRDRSLRQAIGRITSLATDVMERSLQESLNAPLKDRAPIINSAIALMKMVSNEDIIDRAERAKNGMSRARNELGEGEEINVTPQQAAEFAKALEAKFPGILKGALEA